MYGIVEKNIKQVELWLSEGLSSRQIADKLGCKKSSVLKKIHEYNLVNSHKCSVDYNNLLVDKLSLIIQMFESGKSINYISKELGYNNVSVWNLLKDNNYDTSKYKIKYLLDESYFEKIDTPNKAYILGWFYSDGNILSSGKCRIQLHEQDRHILEDISKELRYTGPLLECPARGSSAPQVCLNIDRRKVAQDLIKLGVTPSKSWTLSFPSLGMLPIELYSHFIRGVFDGDGSISCKQRKTVVSLSCGLTGLDTFMNKIKTVLETNSIFPSAFYYRRPGKPFGSLFFGRQAEAKKFLNWIYKDAELKLQRKYKKALPFLSEGV